MKYLLCASLALLIVGCQSGRHISIVDGGSTTAGYVKHWDMGSKSAWYSMKTHEVLITDSKDNSVVKLTELPKEYGHIIATGWEKNDPNRFFVHFSKGSDHGTMVYIDLQSGLIDKTESWNGI